MTAIYVHVPFCAKHCAYCDFNTYVEKSQERIERTVCATINDIRQTASSLDRRLTVETVFLGGGTPTLLSSIQIVSLLDAIRESFDVLPDAEISSEANPTSVDTEKFSAMREAGFNRLSIGVQSFDNQLLVALDRFHTADEASRAFDAARSAGFANINLDLMFGLPLQTEDRWKASLDRALEAAPQHLSLYALTLEPGTRFERLHTGGKLQLPDEDAELAMYETAISDLTSAGYEHYEVSNFALPGSRCQHNQAYWRNDEYLGFGPGAVSYWNGNRFKKETLPERYVRKVADSEPLVIEEETLTREERLGETMMLGLRMTDGISLSAMNRRFETEIRDIYAKTLSSLEAAGRLCVSGDRIRLTRNGLLFANEALAEFLIG